MMSEEINSYLNHREIVELEAQYIDRRRKANGRRTTKRYTALCLSGGGIRSAAFSLGFVRGLAAENKLLGFDYLSTVSGGGFTGGLLSLWIKKELSNSKSESDVHEIIALPGAYSQNPLHHLRRYTNYLTPKLGIFSLDSLTGVLTFFRNFLTNFVLINLFIVSAILATMMIIKLPNLLLDEANHSLIPNAVSSISSEWLFLVGIAGILYIYATSLRFGSITTQLDVDNELLSEGKVGYSGISDLMPVTYFLSALLLTFSLILFTHSDRSGINLACSFDWSELKAATHLNKINPLIDITNFIGNKITRCAPISITLFTVLFVIIAAYVIFIDEYYSIVFSKNKSKSAENSVASTSRSEFSLWSYTWPFLFEAITFVALGFVVIYNVNKSVDYTLLLAFGPPVVCAIHLVGQIIYLLLTSKRPNYAIHREWISRFIASQIRIPLAWLFVALSIIYAENIVNFAVKFIPDEIESVGLLGVSASILGVIAPFLSREVGADDQKPSWLSWVSRILLAIILPFFAFCMLIIISITLKIIIFSFENSYSITIFEITLAGFLICLGLGLFISSIIDINRFSVHDMYKNRIIRAFLGGLNDDRKSDPFTDFDINDDVLLSSLNNDDDKKLGPLHLFNMSLNNGASSELIWQERKALPFTASPVSVGSAMLGKPIRSEKKAREGCYRPTVEFGSKNQSESLSLGDAMSISGAAFSTAMGQYSSAILTTLLMIFNMRLGVWIGNPMNNIASKTKSPRQAMRPLAQEFFGKTSDSSPYINASDGGHFDNLGLYEVLMRKCRRIIVVDVGCDPHLHLHDLGKVIQMVQLDSENGINVEFDQMHLEEIRDLNNSRCIARAKVTYYGENEEGNNLGYLYYIKPKRTGDSYPADIISYSSSNPQFPHEATTDQWFGESQFSAYVKLGEIISRKLNRNSIYNL